MGAGGRKKKQKGIKEKWKEGKIFPKGWLPGMLNWSAGETSLCFPSLSFDTDHVPEASVCWMQHLFPIFLSGVDGEEENPAEVKSGNNSESESPDLPLPHPQAEQPKTHVWHTCPTAASGAGCSLMPQPSLALHAMPCVAGLPLQLSAGPFMCWCHFVPGIFRLALERVYPRAAGWARRAFVAQWRGSGAAPAPLSSIPAAHVPAHSPGREAVRSILDILTKQRECPPWFCLDIFHGAYFPGWLWLLTPLQMV